MNLELSRKDLKALVRGKQPDYSVFNNPLVIKVGHSYGDQYGRTDWSNLDGLSDEELYQLYKICKNSYK